MTDFDETPLPPSAEDDAPATLLVQNRPAPPQAFVGSLGRQLHSEDPGWEPRPPHLWLPALGLIAVGAVLLIIGALIGVGGI